MSATGEIVMENYKEENLVSVGIPAYNRPEGLRRTLECMTQQTYSNLEIIVSDNCSPIREIETIVQKFMENDSRIQYFRQEENKGVNFNFQFVLEMATGKYFMWAADDDAWEQSYISCMVEALESNQDAVLSFCDFDYTYVDRPPLVYRDKWSKIIGLSRFYRLLYTFCLMPEVVTAYYAYGLMRRDIILKSGGWKTQIEPYSSADILPLLRVLYYGKFIKVDKLLFHSSQRSTSTESRAQRLAKQSFYTLVTRYLRWLNIWHQHNRAHRVIVKESPLAPPQKIILLAVLYMNELIFYFNSLIRTFIGYVLNKPF